MTRLLHFLRDHGAKIYFGFGVAVLVFGYGVAVGRYQVFPFGVLQDAKRAADEVRGWAELKRDKPIEQHPHVIVHSNPVSERAIAHEPAAVSPGYTLIAAFDDERFVFGVDLIDMEGRLVHRWAIPDQVLALLAEKDFALRP